MANEQLAARRNEEPCSDRNVQPEEREGDAPEAVLPRDIKTVFLGGLFFLAVLTTLFVAAEIVMPVVLAIILKLLIEPVLRPFDRLHIPRPIGSLVAVVLLVSGLVGVGVLVAGPAMNWMEKVPEGFPRLEEHLKEITQPLAVISRVLHRAERAAQGPTDGTPEVTVKSAGMADILMAGTLNFFVGFATVILLLFFLLAAGDMFMRRVVEVLPRFKDKRQAVEIVQHVEQDISRYLLTISVINLAVGLATGIAFHLCGLEDALLWTALAFVLNYVPILGPLVGVGLFALVGLLSFETLGAALLPAGLYLLIHIVEGEFVTPLLLAKRLTLNPVLIILSLIFWYWMWGVPGAMLAVPILAMIKIICDRIEPLMAVGHFLEGGRGTNANGGAAA